MAEKLFIRLGSQPTDTIHWLILAETDSNETDIIACGELEGAKQLTELTSKAELRRVQVFVPGCDVLLKRLNIPAKSNRAMRLAVPYALEDNFAEEVEQLFFAYADLPKDNEGHNCFTAIVSHNQLQEWLTWLSDAEIVTKSILPETLVMPINDEGWSAIALGGNSEQQVIVRQGEWEGFTLDSSTWQLQCQAFSHQQAAEVAENEEQDNSIAIEAYSPLAHSENLAISSMSEELPLALMAKTYRSKPSRFNLLQGQYKVKESRSHAGQQWLWVAGVAVFALLLTLGNKSVQLWQLNAEQEIVENSIIDTYKKAFPKTKRVRISTIKSQLNRELALLGGVSDRKGFLAMFTKVQPAFAKVPGLKPESLKFDGKRQELRLQAKAKDYQTFEKFSIALTSENLTVKQGSQSNQEDGVTGSFTITNKATSSREKKKKASTNIRNKKNNKETS